LSEAEIPSDRRLEKRHREEGSGRAFRGHREHLVIAIRPICDLDPEPAGKIGRRGGAIEDHRRDLRALAEIDVQGFAADLIGGRIPPCRGDAVHRETRVSRVAIRRRDDRGLGRQTRSADDLTGEREPDRVATERDSE
jgi:hypothetical protein